MRVRGAEEVSLLTAEIPPQLDAQGIAGVAEDAQVLGKPAHGASPDAVLGELLRPLHEGGRSLPIGAAENEGQTDADPEHLEHAAARGGFEEGCDGGAGIVA